MKKSNTENVELLKIKALIYGGSGVGKTYTARTLPEKKTRIISAESGLLSLSGTNIDVVELENWNDLKELYSEFMTEEHQKKYDFIFIDSLTEINEMCKEHIVKVERPAVRGKVGKIYDDILDMQDWGLVHTKMSRMIRMFRDLPYNIIFTCLEDEKKDERTGAVTVLPSLNGKLQTNIAQYFDMVFRLISEDDKAENKTYRNFLTEKTEKSLAKDRSGVLDRLELPNWEKVISKIKKEIGSKK